MERPNLFSPRNITPPQPFPTLPQPFSSSETSSPPSHLESLFQSLGSSSSNPAHSPPVESHSTEPPANVDDHLAVTSPSLSAQNQATTERQNVLLNLLSSASNPTPPRPAPQQIAGPSSPPQQVPTPPGSAHLPAPPPPPQNDNEAQGRSLLEQLMSSAALPMSYPDSQPSSHLSLPAVSPAGSFHPPEHEQYSFHTQEVPRGDEYPGPQNPSPPAPPMFPAAPIHQPPPPQPSPPRKSTMFDFNSPFDALSSPNSAPASLRKKSTDDSWPSISSVDPKRKSVENLLDQLTRGQAPPPPPLQPPPPVQPETITPTGPGVPGGYEYSSDDHLSQAELLQPRGAVPPQQAPFPKPPKVASPRSSPPKLQAQRQMNVNMPVARSGESPVGQGIVGRKEKDHSPAPRGGNHRQEARGKNGKGKGNGGNSSVPPPQSIVFDVSSPLDEIQAPLDYVKYTAIALVKIDPVFLPGTTIGVTQWVAYAMTRGRVRVISRQSGDRTLLQLPHTFPTSTAVTDMAVHGNRLAGITSDGGLIVWELPDIITDDVPGRVLLCVAPAIDIDGLHSVKWHPGEHDTLAVASDSTIYYLDLANAERTFGGDPIPQMELARLGPVFHASSRIIAFDFDVVHYAIASISEDSSLVLWNLHDKIPFWTQKVRGDDTPSSLTFVEDGIIVGRKNGTVFQLLSNITRQVLSTIKFVNGQHQDDIDMFGHINYDARIQTLWVANSRRDSLVAIKLGYEHTLTASAELVRGPFFEQVTEFAGLKPTIHFVILTGDADPHGDEAHAACVAAKITPGELALVSFSVHSTGVDQILIRREWFDSAMANTHAKFPAYALPPPPPSSQQQQAQPQSQQQTPILGAESKTYRGPVASIGLPLPPPPPTQSQTPPYIAPVPKRPQTPPYEDAEIEAAARDDAKLQESRGGRNAKGKNVLWKDKDEGSSSVQQKEKELTSQKEGGNGGGSSGKSGKADKEAAVLNDSALGQVLSREIRKSEENLHVRIGRLIGKEMEKQHTRLEEARLNDQAAEFNRQETILKMISTELTKNTQRVVEVAVKSEIRDTVLPSLENITRNEVKMAMNEHLGRGLGDYVQKGLPVELEKLLVRPDISGHFAHMLSSNLVPLFERHVRDSIHKGFLPIYTQQSSSSHDELMREMRNELHTMKADMNAWRNDVLRTQEATIRDLELTVRSLSDQVKYLSLNGPTNAPLVHPQVQQARGSPSGPTGMGSGLMHQTTLPPANPPAPTYNHPSYAQPPPQQPMQRLQPQWYPTNIAAPQASHPLAPPPAGPALNQRPSPPPEDWDNTYITVLGQQDARQFRDLLLRSNPDHLLPLNGPCILSGPVILALISRLSGVLSDAGASEDTFKSALWWLQRASLCLNVKDPQVSAFVARVLPNVQTSLNTIKSRLAIIPGGSSIDLVRSLSEIQDTLVRKTLQ